MISGVGLFGTFTACVASWFMAGVAEKEESELTQIREELAHLRQTIELYQRREQFERQ